MISFTQIDELLKLLAAAIKTTSQHDSALIHKEAIAVMSWMEKNAQEYLE